MDEDLMAGVCGICGAPVDRSTVDAHMDAEHPAEPMFVRADDWLTRAQNRLAAQAAPATGQPDEPNPPDFIDRLRQEDHIIVEQSLHSYIFSFTGTPDEPPAGPPPDLKEQAVQAVAVAITPANARHSIHGMARIAVEAVWDLFSLDYIDHKERDRLRQHVIDLRAMHAEEERTAWDRVAALEQAAKDLVTTLNKPIPGRRVGEYATNLERLRAVIDGTHEATP
jgi:hypothetical protein